MPKTKNINQQVATAYHEAGHAVVAYWKRTSFKYVTIIPNNEEATLGHLKHWPLPKWFQPDIEYSSRIRDKLENCIMVSLAGHIAEKKFTKRNNNIGSSCDMKAAVTLASYMGGDAKGTGLFMDWIWNCTEGHVDVRWKDIEAVAQALLEKKTLSKTEVREIIMSIYNIGKFNKLALKFR